MASLPFTNIIHGGRCVVLEMMDQRRELETLGLPVQFYGEIRHQYQEGAKFGTSATLNSNLNSLPHGMLPVSL